MIKKLFTYLLIFPILPSCTIKPNQSDLKFSDSVYQDIASSTMDYPFTATVVDRKYVESVLNQVFDVTSTETSVLTGVYNKSDFGGGCDRYASSDNGVTYEFPKDQCYSGIFPFLPSYSNPMRYSYTVKTCETLINSSARFTSVMQKIYPTWAGGSNILPAPNAITIKTAYQLFFQSEEPGDDLTQSFLVMSSAATTTNEGWKQIMTTLCGSPEWQIF